MSDKYGLKPGEEVVIEFEDVACVGVPDEGPKRQRIVPREGREWYEYSAGNVARWETLKTLRTALWRDLAYELNRRCGSTNPSDEEPTIPLSVVMEGKPAIAAYLYVVYGHVSREIAEILDVSMTTVHQYHSMFRRKHR